MVCALTRFREERLERAHRMLLSQCIGHLHITDIAYPAGVNDLLCLNRVFRRRFDGSPGEIRELGRATPFLEQLERSTRDLGIERLDVEASITATGFYERHGYFRTGAIRAGTAGPQTTLTKQVIESL